MTNLKITATIATAVLLSLTIFSCKENKSSKETAMEKTSMKSGEMASNGTQATSAKQVVADYM